MQRENLNWIMDKLPQEFQDRAKYWYVGANRFSEELAIKYGIPRQSMSGVLAALSPQMDWFKNASLGERVVDAVINNRAFSLVRRNDQCCEAISNICSNRKK